MRVQRFREFLKENGVRQSFSAPHHPATNGAAENFVATFKDKVTKIMKGRKSLEEAVNLFLFTVPLLCHPALYNRSQSGLDGVKARTPDKV